MSNTKIPDKWYLAKTKDSKKKQIIYDWMQTQEKGDHWELRYPEDYHLHNKKEPVGYASPRDGHTKISFIQFEKHVVGNIKPEKGRKPKKPENLDYLKNLFEELNIK